MTDPLHEALARESDRHDEIREALVARRGERMAHLLFQGAQSTWIAKNLLEIITRPGGHPLMAQLFAETQVRDLLGLHSGLLYDALKREHEASGGGEATVEVQKGWMAEIEILVARMKETEANLHKTIKGLM